MALSVKRVDGSQERQVLIGMITLDDVVGPISAKWKRDLFPSDWGNLVGSWCVNHFVKYGKAPRKSIQQYFREWAEIKRDPSLIEPIESLLSGLSQQSVTDHLVPGHVTDIASRLFTATLLKKLTASVEASLESGDVLRADELVSAYRRIEMGPGTVMDLQTAKEQIVAAFSQKWDVVVTYPDALGSFYGKSLSRDGFIAFLAPMKRGKSYFLQDMAWRAVEQGRRVLYFECGDHSENQALIRLSVRASGRPAIGDRKHPFKVPTLIESPSSAHALPDVAYRELWSEDDLTGEEAYEEIDQISKMSGDATLFKLSVHHTSSLSVRDADAMLDELARDDWFPDVILFDYADILKPIDPKMDKRDQVNETWKALRAMSQKRRALVVTATQTNADGNEANLLRRTHFSEDNRKLAQVTGMVGINQNTEEKKNNLYRLNWIARRDLDFSEDTCVHLAHCLAIGNPAVVSTF